MNQNLAPDLDNGTVIVLLTQRRIHLELAELTIQSVCKIFLVWLKASSHFTFAARVQTPEPKTCTPFIKYEENMYITKRYM